MKIDKRTNCPSCGCSDLITLETDQICSDCDWNTCKEYVDAGRMDNLHAAFREHFPHAQNPSNLKEPIETQAEPISA